MRRISIGVYDFNRNTILLDPLRIESQVSTIRIRNLSNGIAYTLFRREPPGKNIPVSGNIFCGRKRNCGSVSIACDILGLISKCTAVNSQRNCESLTFPIGCVVTITGNFTLFKRYLFLRSSIRQRRAILRGLEPSSENIVFLSRLRKRKGIGLNCVGIRIFVYRILYTSIVDGIGFQLPLGIVFQITRRSIGNLCYRLTVTGFGFIPSRKTITILCNLVASRQGYRCAMSIGGDICVFRIENAAIMIQRNSIGRRGCTRGQRNVRSGHGKAALCAIVSRRRSTANLIGLSNLIAQVIAIGRCNRESNLIAFLGQDGIGISNHFFLVDRKGHTFTCSSDSITLDPFGIEVNCLADSVTFFSEGPLCGFVLQVGIPTFEDHIIALCSYFGDNAFRDSVARCDLLGLHRRSSFFTVIEIDIKGKRSPFRFQRNVLNNLSSEIERSIRQRFATLLVSGNLIPIIKAIAFLGRVIRLSNGCVIINRLLDRISSVICVKGYGKLFGVPNSFQRDRLCDKIVFADYWFLAGFTPT